MKYILELEDEPNKEYFGEGNYYRCKQIPYWSISESMRNRLEPYDEADRKTEPTISKMEQVDKDINVRSKDKPQIYVINPQEPTNDDKCFECDDFFTCGGQCNKIEDEQTESDRIDNEIEYAWKTYCDTDE